MSIVTRSFRHWTARYIFDRLALIQHEYRHPDAPWLTAEMVRILESWLTPSDVGLEWGSGRSTVWFARRVTSLTSVEHDAGWARQVAMWLDEEGLSHRVHYQLISCSAGNEEKAFTEYTGVCDRIPSETLDFCLIDGLARDDCAVSCVDKLKPGGIIIVDNANWYLPHERKSNSPNSRGVIDGPASKKWGQFADAVREWRYIWTSNGVMDTALWVKPAKIVEL